MEKGHPRVDFIDVDEEFDRLEFEARQERMGKRKESPPKWNTHIEGLVVETPAVH